MRILFNLICGRKNDQDEVSLFSPKKLMSDPQIGYILWLSLSHEHAEKIVTSQSQLSCKVDFWVKSVNIVGDQCTSLESLIFYNGKDVREYWTWRIPCYTTDFW